jgi:hypothetical protein
MLWSRPSPYTSEAEPNSKTSKSSMVQPCEAATTASSSRVSIAWTIVNAEVGNTSVVINNDETRLLAPYCPINQMLRAIPFEKTRRRTER